MTAEVTSKRSPIPRLTLYPIAVVFAITLGVLIGAVNADSNQSSYGGDYPAFYGAGKIAASGDWDSLYELRRQIEAQRGLFPEADVPSARYFAYPPQVALAYRPLAALDYFPSFVLHSLLMGLLLWASLMLVRPMIPWLQGRVALGLASALAFWPVFRSVFGGSNATLTIFLIVAGWRLIYEDRQLAAGFVLSGLMFKPQLGLPIIGLFLVARFWRVVAGAIGGSALFYLSGAALLGWAWVPEWIDVAREFGRVDTEVNGHSAISFIGVAENFFGVGLSVPVFLAWLLAGATTCFLSWLWWSSRGQSLDRLLAITMPGILLLSLHALSHDSAILVITMAVLCEVWRREQWLPWVIVFWLLGASQSFIRQVGWSPGIVLLLLALWSGWSILGVPRFGQSDTLGWRNQ